MNTDAKEIVHTSQTVGLLAALTTFIGHAEGMKEKTSMDLLVTIELQNPQRSKAVVNFAAISDALKDKAVGLVNELNSKGVNTDEMMLEIEKEIEQFYNK